VLDLDHVQFAREWLSISLGGDGSSWEARSYYNAFIMAQAKAHHPEIKDRYFNVALSSSGGGSYFNNTIRSASLSVEHSVCPHEYSRLVDERYGRNLDAFWPVVDRRLDVWGIMMANEAPIRENARALAMNGAEVVYRASYPHPATGNDIFEIQSRARALDNNMYLVAPIWVAITPCQRRYGIDTLVGAPCHQIIKGKIVGRQVMCGCDVCGGCD